MEQRERAAQTKLRRRPITRSLVRRILGWSLIVLGGLGIILPVLPGLVLFALGIVVIGPHDPTLRRVAVGVRLLLRRWSRVSQRHLRWMGRWAWIHYSEARRVVREHLHRHQHGAEGWRAHLALLGVVLLGMSISAGVLFAAWHTIP